MAIRDDRLTWPFAGTGGFLEFSWPEGGEPHQSVPGSSDVPQSVDSIEKARPTWDYRERLEVLEWTVQPIYRDLEIAGSGNFGSIMRRRVVADFKWTANIDLDLTPSLATFRNVNSSNQIVYEARMEGNKLNHFQIGMRFQIGDPSLQVPALDAPAESGLYYWCPAVMLNDVLLRNPVKDRGVVRCVVRGSGSAPLERWMDGKVLGAGAFGFTLEQQGLQKKVVADA